jgi:hypothetical protein
MHYVVWLEQIVSLLKKTDETGRFSVMEEREIEDLLHRFYPRLYTVFINSKPTAVEMVIELLQNNDFMHFKKHENVSYLTDRKNVNRKKTV